MTKPEQNSKPVELGTLERVAAHHRLPNDLTLTLSVEQAGRLFGIGRTKAYQEARRFIQTAGTEGIPTIELGGSLRCPTAMVLRVLGIDPNTGVAV